MAERIEKLDISPKVLDLGGRLVQVQHVSIAGFATSHPLRPLGVALLAGALYLIGSEAALGTQAFALKTGGSFKLWLGFGATGLAIFSFIYSRRQLLLRASDGTSFALQVPDDKFAATVLGHIREAIEAPAGSTLRYVIDLKAGTVATGGAASTSVAPVARDQFHAPVPPSMSAPQPIAMANEPYRNRPTASQPMTATPAPLNGTYGGHPMNGTMNGAGPANGHAPGPMAHSGPNAGFGHPMAHRMTPAAQPQPHASPYGAQTMAAHATPLRVDPAREMADLIELVSRSTVQHKDALVDLLKVVEDHVRGGPTIRDDAVSHWKSFSEYVHQYLGNTDGLGAATERFGRQFGRI